MAKRKQHRGVTLIKPSKESRAGWRARFIDPDSGKAKWQTLEREDARTLELRESWAVSKSQELAQRRLELEGGATRASGTLLADAVAQYYADHPALRPSTLRAYTDSTDKFLRWAKRSRVRSADDVTRGRLVAFRATIVNERKHVAKFGGDRGEYTATNERRSPYSINRDLRGVLTVLRYMHTAEMLPKVSRDDLAAALKRERTPVERKHYLKPKQIQRVLEAAQRHDSDTDTLRPLPDIAPFTAFLLLTGMRRGEALALTWEQVDLDARDYDGNDVGEIYVTSASKTSKARTVGLEISPALRRLLIAQRMRTGGKGSVFSLETGQAKKAGERLRETYGAPAQFDWQCLRRTCGTYLVNAPGIPMDVWATARQLGHGVDVAEKHYNGLIRGIPRELRTLESAMQIEPQLAELTKAISEPRKRRAS